ncbi:MAG: hypothetical protein R2827_12740 [Bdellovibrionales bacterium]
MNLGGFAKGSPEEVLMGYKYNEKKKCWEAWHSARHPITRKPEGLRRRAEVKAEARRLEGLIAEVMDRLHRKVTPLGRR